MMKREFSFLLACFLLTLSLTLVAAIDWNDWTECTSIDGCGNCLLNPKCGYCGFFGNGMCVPGNIDGSLITPPMNACRTDYWHYGVERGCVDHIREVKWNKTDIKIEWNVMSVTGLNFSDYTVNAVLFALSFENNEDAVLALGHATGNSENLDFTFNAISWDNFVEFKDKNGDGMWDPWTEWATRVYNISSSGVLPIQYSNTSENGTVIHHGSLETVDGVYKLICHVSANDYSVHDGGKVFSPFEMKCDIALNNYERLVPTDLLAINTFIVSAQASFNVSGNSTVKKCQMGNGEAFFDWEDYIEIDGTNETAEVKVSDLKLDGVQFPWSDSPVYTTIFSFQTLSGTWLWDPLVGIQQTSPPAPEDSSDKPQHSSNANSNGNSNSNNNQGSGEVSAGSAIAVCFKVMAFILSLSVFFAFLS